MQDYITSVLQATKITEITEKVTLILFQSPPAEKKSVKSWIN